MAINRLPGKYPGKIRIYRGTDFNVLISKIPYEIINFNFDAGLYSKSDSSLIYNFTVIMVNDPAKTNSYFLMSLTKTEIDNIPTANYNLFIKQTDDSGKITPFIVGEVNIISEKNI